MDLKECYDKMGGGFEEVKRRLNKEERIQRFLFLFPKDENYQALERAVAGEDWEGAFRAAHTLKGVAMNLSLGRLSQSAIRLTDALRGGTAPDNAEELFAQVREDYQTTVQAISELKQCVEG